MKIILSLFVFTLFFSCTSTEDSTSMSVKQENLNGQSLETDCDYVAIDAENVECPEGHTDSIIPILYGFPTEEMFAHSDSGLIALGGCEITDCDPNWWCKIHEIGF